MDGMNDDEKTRKLKQAIDILSSIPSTSHQAGGGASGSGTSRAAASSHYRGRYDAHSTGF